MASLIDSHCHLDFPDFAEERQEVIDRARAFGVGEMLTICTKLTDFPSILGIAESDPRIWCSVGIHPHEAESQPDTSSARLAGLAAHPKVVAIGECGLDYYYDHSPRVRQQAVFRTHAEAAIASGLPLIVHTRDADEDTARLLTESGGEGNLTGVLHCFSSGRALAERALQLGFYISFSGIVTFKNAEAVREVARIVPLDRLLIETDSPFLAPVPHRGKRNEPAFVAQVAAYVAQLREIDLEELGRVTSDNFHRLFQKTAA